MLSHKAVRQLANNKNKRAGAVHAFENVSYNYFYPSLATLYNASRSLVNL